MIKILKVEDARGKQTSKHQRHNIARRRNRYARAFPPETRQPDRAPIVLFTTFLRWRRYWQFGVFEIHKDDKSNGSCVPSSPFLSLSLSHSSRVARPPLSSIRACIHRFARCLLVKKGSILYWRRDRHTRNCIVKIIFGIDPLVKFVILSPLSWYI